jgi:hypothetical protein
LFDSLSIGPNDGAFDADAVPPYRVFASRSRTTRHALDTNPPPAT